MEKAQNNTVKRHWSIAETKAFLTSYLTRKGESEDVRKKKSAMKNVLQDLMAQGILTDRTTVSNLKVKLRSLLRAFKASKDSANRSGAGSQYFPYEGLMEEIFGRSPIVSTSEVVQVGFGKSVALVEEPIAAELPSSASCSQTTTVLAVNSDDLLASTSTAASSSGGQPEQRTRPRQTAKERYYDRKIELMEKYLDGKAKRHEAYLKEKERCRQQRHEERMREIQRIDELG